MLDVSSYFIHNQRLPCEYQLCSAFQPTECCRQGEYIPTGALDSLPSVSNDQLNVDTSSV